MLQKPITDNYENRPVVEPNYGEQVFYIKNDFSTLTVTNPKTQQQISCNMYVRQIHFYSYIVMFSGKTNTGPKPALIFC